MTTLVFSKILIYRKKNDLAELILLIEGPREVKGLKFTLYRYPKYQLIVLAVHVIWFKKRCTLYIVRGL